MFCGGYLIYLFLINRCFELETFGWYFHETSAYLPSLITGCQGRSQAQGILFGSLKWPAELCYLLFQPLLFHRVFLPACHLFPELPALPELSALSSAQRTETSTVLHHWLMWVRSVTAHNENGLLFLHRNETRENLEFSCSHPSDFCCQCLQTEQRGSIAGIFYWSIAST